MCSLVFHLFYDRIQLGTSESDALRIEHAVAPTEYIECAVFINEHCKTRLSIQQRPSIRYITHCDRLDTRPWCVDSG